MCGRTVVVTKTEVVEKVFNVRSNPQLDLFQPNYNLSIGQYSPVILCENPHELVLGRFGLSPSWAKKDLYLFNARSEGDGNKENDPRYSGGMGIINKPSFKNLIRSKRCLVIVDAFYEGSQEEGLSKPYLVYLRNRKPFALAGIYDTWKNEKTGELILGYAIVTIWANELLRKIGHHRSPVILPKSAEGTWLNKNAPLSAITTLLRPYPVDEMNAYPVSPEMKSPKINTKDLVQPIGPRLLTEYEVKTVTKYESLEERRRKRR